MRRRCSGSTACNQPHPTDTTSFCRIWFIILCISVDLGLGKGSTKILSYVLTRENNLCQGYFWRPRSVRASQSQNRSSTSWYWILKATSQMYLFLPNSCLELRKECETATTRILLKKISAVFWTFNTNESKPFCNDGFFCLCNLCVKSVVSAEDVQLRADVQVDGRCECRCEWCDCECECSICTCPETSDAFVSWKKFQVSLKKNPHENTKGP